MLKIFLECFFIRLSFVNTIYLDDELIACFDYYTLN